MALPRPRPGILEIAPYVGGKAELATKKPVLKLSANESALGPSPKAVAAYRELAGQLHRYPDGGSTELRRAIGRRHNLDPDRLVCGAGSDELIALLIRAFAGPGDEVLYSRHGFLMYKLAALAAGAHPVSAPERQLTADVDALLAAVTSRTRLLFLANPNNPTGTYLPASELRRLHGRLPEDVVLVVDAAYAEFVTAADYDSGLELALDAPNVVMIRTFSKLHGLAALRLGWMTGSLAIVDVINRVRGPFNVVLPAQAAGVAALEDMEHQERARRHNERWLPWVSAALRDLGLVVQPGVANFVLVTFPGAPGRDAPAAIRFLEGEGIIPRDVVAYGLPQCMRITIGLEEDNHRLVETLRAFVQGRAAA